jgi:hypothetical protein
MENSPRTHPTIVKFGGSVCDKTRGVHNKNTTRCGVNIIIYPWFVGKLRNKWFAKSEFGIQNVLFVTIGE